MASIPFSRLKFVFLRKCQGPIPVMLDVMLGKARRYRASWHPMLPWLLRKIRLFLRI